jgi:hypothetical protein
MAIRQRVDELKAHFGPAGLFMKAWKPFCCTAEPAAAILSRVVGSRKTQGSSKNG